MSKSNRTGGRAARRPRRAAAKTRSGHSAPVFALPSSLNLHYWQPVAAIVLGLLVTVVLGRALAMAVDPGTPPAIVNAAG